MKINDQGEMDHLSNLLPWSGNIIRTQHVFVERIDNSSRESLLGITGLCRVMPNSDPRYCIFYLIHIRII